MKISEKQLQALMLICRDSLVFPDDKAATFGLVQELRAGLYNEIMRQQSNELVDVGEPPRADS